MMEVVLLLSAVGVSTIAATWRLLTYRFPHPADLIALSVFYYSIPLATFAIFLPDLGRLVFLHPAAVDRDISIQSIRFALLALVCLELGRRLAKKFRLNRRIQFSVQPADWEKGIIVLGGLLCLIALGIALYGPASFFAGYNVQSDQSTAALGNALIYASIELIGTTMGYMYITSKALRVRFASPLLLVAMAFLVFLAVARGKRLEVISAFLPLGVLLFAMHPLFRSARSRAVAIGVVAVLISVLASFRLGRAPTPVLVVYNFLTEGIFAGHALPGIIDRLNLGQVGYEYGTRVVLAVLAFVPRFIWPTKDDIVYAGNQALEGVSPLGATNILAEVLLQGGGIAIIIWYTCFGFLCERVYGGQRNFDGDLREGRISGATLGYLILVATFVPHFRDGIIPSIKLLLQVAVFLFALAGLAPSLPINWRARIARRSSATAIRDTGTPRASLSV
jgi:hypothetical protein